MNARSACACGHFVCFRISEGLLILREELVKKVLEFTTGFIKLSGNLRATFL